MYKINDTPISHWNLKPATIKTKLDAYALSGIWSLPKRLGKTHHNWSGTIEPYVDADDIVWDGRELELKLSCTAKTQTERNAIIDKFKSDIGNAFTISHDVLGTFEVGLEQIKVKEHGGGWAELTLMMRQCAPPIGTTLPPTDGTSDNPVCGIDNRSWQSLGLVVSSIDNRLQLPKWKEYGVTKNPLKDTFCAGYRDTLPFEINATLKGATYADFSRNVSSLQALIGSAGLRTIRYFDKTLFDAFCVDGFTVSEVKRFGTEHWAEFKCNFIKL